MVKAGDPVGNEERSREFEIKRRLNKIGTPVDRSEFHMTPPTVNAYDSPQENNINFPAGILQPPFFDNDADMAASFGAIGTVIGHELTHGFDDEGRHFDADGNLRDWWTAQDATEFTKRADCIAGEYSKFSPTEGAYVNRRLTLGENGADNAGIRLAYMALLRALENGSLNKEKLDAVIPSNVSTWALHRSIAEASGRSLRVIWYGRILTRPASFASSERCKTSRSSFRHSDAQPASRWSPLMVAGSGNPGSSPSANELARRPAEPDHCGRTSPESSRRPV